MKPRVAVYVPHGAVPDRRGFAPAIVAEQLARRCKRFEPLAISAREDGLPARHRAGDLECRHLDMSSAYVRLFTKLTRLDPWPLHARLAAMLKRAPVDLLHAHQLEFPVDAFLRRCGAPLPVVVHAHVTTQRPGGRLADAYLAVSDYVRQRLIEKGFPDDRLHLVRNGVDTRLFRPATPAERTALRAAAGLGEQTTVLLFFGRKQEVKGFDVFLRVAEALLALRRDLAVFAVGPEPADARREPSYADCREMRRRLAASGRFFDLPASSQDRLADYLRLADVALLPSRAEPQGMAMVEAMAAGCATVSTRVGGIPESIDGGRNGELLDLPSAEDQAIRAIQALIDSPQRRRELAAEAARTVRERFDWDRSAARSEEIYERLISAARRREAKAA